MSDTMRDRGGAQRITPTSISKSTNHAYLSKQASEGNQVFWGNLVEGVTPAGILDQLGCKVRCQPYGVPPFYTKFESAQLFFSLPCLRLALAQGEPASSVAEEAENDSNSI